MHKGFYTLLAIFALTFVACDRSDNKTPGSGKEVKITTSFGKWTYFSFAKGDTVGTGSANAETDALWKARTDWDMAFLINNARTNSGTSGNGQGGVYYAGTDQFNAVTVAPEEGYTTDTNENIMYNMSRGPQYGIYPVNAAFVYTNVVGNGFELAPKIFVVKTADGRYAKVFIKEMVSDPANIYGRILTIEYFYQADGSTYLETLKQ